MDGNIQRPATKSTRRRSWYKYNPAQALAFTRLMTLEERGAFIVILDLFHAEQGNLPDMDRLIAGYMNCDIRIWRRLKARLIQLEKIKITDGKVYPSYG